MTLAKAYADAVRSGFVHDHTFVPAPEVAIKYAIIIDNLETYMPAGTAHEKHDHRHGRQTQTTYRNEPERNSPERFGGDRNKVTTAGQTHINPNQMKIFRQVSSLTS